MCLLQARRLSEDRRLSDINCTLIASHITSDTVKLLLLLHVLFVLSCQAARLGVYLGRAFIRGNTVLLVVAQLIAEPTLLTHHLFLCVFSANLFIYVYTNMVHFIKDSSTTSWSSNTESINSDKPNNDIIVTSTSGEFKQLFCSPLVVLDIGNLH